MKKMKTINVELSSPKREMQTYKVGLLSPKREMQTINVELSSPKAAMKTYEVTAKPATKTKRSGLAQFGKSRAASAIPSTESASGAGQGTR